MFLLRWPQGWYDFSAVQKKIPKYEEASYFYKREFNNSFTLEPVGRRQSVLSWVGRYLSQKEFSSWNRQIQRNYIYFMYIRVAFWMMMTLVWSSPALLARQCLQREDWWVCCDQSTSCWKCAVPHQTALRRQDQQKSQRLLKHCRWTAACHCWQNSVDCY